MSFWKKKLLTFSSILTEITPLRRCTYLGRYGRCTVTRAIRPTHINTQQLASMSWLLRVNCEAHYN